MLEAADAWHGELADYADDTVDPRAGYNNEIVSSEDEGDARATLHGGPQRLGAPEAAAGLLRARQGTMGNDSFIEGFVKGPVGRERDLTALAGLQDVAEGGDRGPARGGSRWGVPKEHKFAQPCALWYGAPRTDQHAASGGAGSGDAVEPPSDAALRDRVNMVAAMVARGGQAMLDMAQRTHAGTSCF